tara:strand:+ start:10042 stop:11808 length:1767 start_codon:yes stop_codon:yes gene_type:complete
MSGSVSPFEVGWSITKESDDKPDRFDFQAEYDPTGLVPEGYAEKHPNEYWEEAHGKGSNPRDWEEMSEEEREAYDERYFSNPLPYPRPLGLLPHSEINRYRDLLDEFRTQFSRFEHNPNLSEDERMELAVSLFNPANEAANLSEDFAEALSSEITYRSQEQTVDAGRRGDIHAGGWKKDGTPFEPRGDSKHLPFTQQFQDIHTGEPMTIRSLLLKALGDPDDMFWWDRFFGGKYPGDGRQIFDWLENNKDIMNRYKDDRKVRWDVDEQVKIPKFSDTMGRTSGKRPVSEANKIVSMNPSGGFGAPDKMPGASFGLPVHLCHVGGRLGMVAGSTCGGSDGKMCYAKQGRYPLNPKQTQLWRNFHGLTDDDPLSYASAFAHRAPAESFYYGTNKFRHMDSGDLQEGEEETDRDYGAQHFAMLNDIASATPQLEHWLPTRESAGVKSFLDRRGWDAIPKNMNVMLSLPWIGQAVDNEINEAYGLPLLGEDFSAGYEELLEHPRIKASSASSLDPSVKSCPASMLGGNCEDYNCDDCWHGTEPISFNVHQGSTKNRPQNLNSRQNLRVAYGDDLKPRVVDSGLDITQFMRKI